MAAQQHLLQSSALPPVQPSYVLRGHTAQIHAVHFLRQNLRLLTGDADGWVVLWDTPIKRPVAVWRAHVKTILGINAWGDDEEKIITHGRDNKLFVWQIRAQDESTLEKALPLDDAIIERKKPWLLHSLDVNALNFCAFAMCNLPASESIGFPEILIATPGINDGAITLTTLPTQTRHSTIPPPSSTKTGMVMALALYYSASDSSLRLMAGYESGHVALYHQLPSQSRWTLLSMTSPHSQPVLSLDLAPKLGFFYSSSADAVVARHSLAAGKSSETEAKSLQTKHAGQQSLTVRSDERIFATAGWDGRVRVYASGAGKGGVKELAVLKWHTEGVYAVAFAEIYDGKNGDGVAKAEDGETEGDGTMTRQILTASQQRLERSRTTHWLAAGSKDGKVSLWDIY